MQKYLGWKFEDEEFIYRPVQSKEELKEVVKFKVATILKSAEYSHFSNSYEMEMNFQSHVFNFVFENGLVFIAIHKATNTFAGALVTYDIYKDMSLPERELSPNYVDGYG